MCLKREKDPTSKQFDDDEWIRSLTETQEATTDIPEDSVTYDQQDFDTKKVRPIQMGEFLRKYVSRSWGSQKNTPEPMIRNMRCRRVVAWRVNGTWTTVTSCATQSWCCLFLQDFDVANARVGAERNPLKTVAAPPEWNIGDVNTLGVAAGSWQFVTDQLLSKADAIRAMHERVHLCQDPLTEFALLRESLGVSRINRILWVHGHTILDEHRGVR